MAEHRRTQPPSLEEVLKRKFTIAKPCVVGCEPGQKPPESPHTIWLVSGAQSFQLDGYMDTAGDAEWKRTMLAKALGNIVRNMMLI